MIFKSLLKKIKNNSALFMLLSLGALILSFGISFHSFTLDETFSLYVTKNWSHMINILWNEEANMWFYYFILRFWRYIGTSELAVRSLSAGFALGTIPFVYEIAKQLFNRKTAQISALLMIINAYYVIASQFARGYSLLLLLTSASTYFFLQLDKDKKFKTLYVLVMTLSIYTHFYAGFVMLSHLLSEMVMKRVRGNYSPFILIGVLLAPILFSPSIQSTQVDWIEAPKLINLIGTAFTLSGDFPLLFVIYGFLFLTITPRVIKNIRKSGYLVLTLWLFVPIAISYLFSLFVKPIYQSVYFLISLPPFILLAASGIEDLRRKGIKVLVLTSIIAFSLLRLTLWYTGNLDYKWVFANNDEDWREATNFIENEAKDEDAIIFYGYYNQMPYKYYSGSNIPEVIEIAQSTYSFGGGTALPIPNYDLLSSLVNSRINEQENARNGAYFYNVVKDTGAMLRSNF